VTVRVLSNADSMGFRRGQRFAERLGEAELHDRQCFFQPLRRLLAASGFRRFSHVAVSWSCFNAAS